MKKLLRRKVNRAQERLSEKRKPKKIIVLIMTLLLAGAGLYKVFEWGKLRYERYVKVYNEFTPEFAPGDTERTRFKADLEGSFNIAFVGLDMKSSGHIKADAVAIIHYDPKSKVFQFMELPVKAYYYYPAKNDYFQLQNIYALGQIESPERGMTDVIDTLERNLALKIDCYIGLDVEGLYKITQILGQINVENNTSFADEDLNTSDGDKSFEQGELSLKAQSLINFVSSDEGGFLSQSDRHYSMLQSIILNVKKEHVYKVIGEMEDLNRHFFSDLDPDSAREIVSFILESKNTVLDTIVADRILMTVELEGQIVNQFAPPLFDELIASVFENSEIIREQARIEIYNGTSVNGLASRYSRFIKNAGGDVIRISTQSGDYPETLIFSEDFEKYTNTLERLKAILPSSSIIEDAPSFTGTGDIIVVLGSDLIDHGQD